MDLHPLTTPDNILTDCVNGTILTQNGNEYILQNDSGNIKLKSSELSPGYLPIGMKEYNGILYIVSYNPLEDKSEIGSYPSTISISNEEDPIKYKIKVNYPNSQQKTIKRTDFEKINPLTEFGNIPFLVEKNDRIAISSLEVDTLSKFFIPEFFIINTKDILIPLSIKKEISKNDYVIVSEKGKLAYKLKTLPITDFKLKDFSYALLSSSKSKQLSLPETNIHTNLNTIHFEFVYSANIKNIKQWNITKDNFYAELQLKLSDDSIITTQNIKFDIKEDVLIGSVSLTADIPDDGIVKTVCVPKYIDDSYIIEYDDVLSENKLQLEFDSTEEISALNYYKYKINESNLNVAFDVLTKDEEIKKTISGKYTLYTGLVKAGNVSLIPIVTNNLSESTLIGMNNITIDSNFYEKDRVYVFSIELLYFKKSSGRTQEDIPITKKFYKFLITSKFFNNRTEQDYSKIPFSVWAGENLTNKTPVINSTNDIIQEIDNIEKWTKTTIRNAQNISIHKDTESSHIDLEDGCTIGKKINKNISISNYLPQELDTKDVDSIWFTKDGTYSIELLDERNNLIKTVSTNNLNSNLSAILKFWNYSYIDLTTDINPTHGSIYDRKYVYDFYSGQKLDIRNFDNNNIYSGNGTNVLQIARDSDGKIIYENYLIPKILQDNIQNNWLSIGKITAADIISRGEIWDKKPVYYTINTKNPKISKAYVSYNVDKNKLPHDAKDIFVYNNQNISFIDTILNLESKRNLFDALNYHTIIKLEGIQKKSLFNLELIKTNFLSSSLEFNDYTETYKNGVNCDCIMVKFDKDGKFQNNNPDYTLIPTIIPVILFNSKDLNNITQMYSLNRYSEDTNYNQIYNIESVIRFASEHLYATTNNHISGDFYIFKANVKAPTNSIKDKIKIYSINTHLNLRSINLWHYKSYFVDTWNWGDVNINFDNFYSNVEINEEKQINQLISYNFEQNPIISNYEIVINKINKNYESGIKCLSQASNEVYSDFEDYMYIYDSDTKKYYEIKNQEDWLNFGKQFDKYLKNNITYDYKNQLFYFHKNSCSFSNLKETTFHMDESLLVQYANTVSKEENAPKIPFPKYFIFDSGTGDPVELYGNKNLNLVSNRFIISFNELKNIINNDK